MSYAFRCSQCGSIVRPENQRVVEGRELCKWCAEAEKDRLRA